MGNKKYNYPKITCPHCGNEHTTTTKCRVCYNREDLKVLNECRASAGLKPLNRVPTPKFRDPKEVRPWGMISCEMNLHKDN